MSPNGIWRCEHLHTKEEHPDCWRQYLEDTSNHTLTEYVKHHRTIQTQHLFYLKDRNFLKLQCPTWHLTLNKRTKENSVLFPMNVNERIIEKEKGVSKWKDQRLKNRPIWFDKGEIKLLIEALRDMVGDDVKPETQQVELQQQTDNPTVEGTS